MILPTVMTLADDALRARARGPAPGGPRARADTHGDDPVRRPAAGGAGTCRRGAAGLGPRARAKRSRCSSSSAGRTTSGRKHCSRCGPCIEAGQTLTSKLGGAETNIAYGDPLHWARDGRAGPDPAGRWSPDAHVSALDGSQRSPSSRCVRKLVDSPRPQCRPALCAPGRCAASSWLIVSRSSVRGLAGDQLAVPHRANQARRRRRRHLLQPRRHADPDRHRIRCQRSGGGRRWR